MDTVLNNILTTNLSCSKDLIVKLLSLKNTDKILRSGSPKTILKAQRNGIYGNLNLSKDTYRESRKLNGPHDV